MRITIAKEKSDASCIAAEIICSQIRKKADSLLGLATGRTMEPVYQKLIWEYRNNRVDFSSISTVNLDEYYGLSKDNPDSYAHFMNRKLFRQVNINRSNVKLLNGQCDDIKKECSNLETFICERNGIDLQLLGIGLNGHIGFNEPGAKKECKTHLEKLNSITRLQNSSLFKDDVEIPQYALTMGIETIMNAKAILLVATGMEKAEIIASTIYENITEEIPSTYLQAHPALHIIIDEEASCYLDKHSNYFHLK